MSPIVNHQRYAALNEKSLEMNEVSEEQKINRSFYEPDEALDLSFADKSGHLNIEGESNFVNASSAHHQELLSIDETDMSEVNDEVKDVVNPLKYSSKVKPTLK